MFRFVYAKVCCRLCLRKKKPSPAPSTPSLAPGGADADLAETKFDKSVTSKDGRATATSMADGKKSAAAADGSKTPAPGDKHPTEGNLPAATEPNVIEEDEEEEEERVTVPLTITMIIITIYILIGSLLFNFFESWGYVTSGYFCYITLATIGNLSILKFIFFGKLIFKSGFFLFCFAGFGDYVPGQNSSDPLANLKLLIGAVYALFGIAILAMCFDLMQEEIIAKFTWLGKKIGIMDKDEDEKAEDERRQQEKREKQFEKQKQKEKLAESAKGDAGVNSPSGKQGLGYGGDRFSNNSPAPSYSATNTTEEERMARIRSAYFKNLQKR